MKTLCLLQQCLHDLILMLSAIKFKVALHGGTIVNKQNTVILIFFKIPDPGVSKCNFKSF
jgi:hypothetical protein